MKLILFIILSTSFSFNSDYSDSILSKTELVIMFDERTSPKLGYEEPLTINQMSDLKNILSDYQEVRMAPLFSFHNTFSSKHYKHHLHQYYLVSFNSDVDIYKLISDLSNIDGIINVEPNSKHKINITPNDQYYNSQWEHENTGQAQSYNGSSVGTPDSDSDTNEAWDITTGDSDVIIAILDTGVNSHEEFDNRLLNGYNFVNNNSNATDGNGHGTACAGIAAGKGNNGVGIAGICWDCNILPVKVLSDEGFGDDTQIADGVQWASDNGADIISMSLGGGAYVSYFDNAINYAVDNGTTVFAASGNDDSSTVSYPSRYTNCISVGSLSPCNERKSFNSCDGENFWGSNYGSNLDFLAPGVRIHTTTYTGSYTSTFNGTSSACPHAAGVAGLILSADQQISPDGVRIIMQESSVDINSPGFDTQTGYGRINAFYALQLILGGPEVSISQANLEIQLAQDQTANETIYIGNSGEMTLSYEMDEYGYNWFDSDNGSTEYNWIDISDDYQTLSFPHNDERSNETIYMPFDFKFYDNYYSSFFVNANGWIGFANDNDAWSNTGLPSTDAPLNAIMPFWDDLNPNNDANSPSMQGDIKYFGNDNYVVVWFDNVRHWVGSGQVDGTYDFQSILFSDGKIKFNYRTMTGDINSATIGMQNSTGDKGITISINSNFVHNDLGVKVQGRPSWLQITPLSSQVETNQTSEINFMFDSSTLVGGTYEYIEKIQTNDFYNSTINIPILLIVSDDPCSGIYPGDLNNDETWNVLDVILTINLILYGSENECDAIIADMNDDTYIDVLDIVLIVNTILDNY